ncbi:MAG: HpaII family restriction endonuclease [Candidatus Saccharimonas sp.]
MDVYTLTANKGEWSELYVLFKLFSDNKIKAADMNLQPTDDEYTFLQIFREDVENRPYIYDLEQDGVVRILTTNGQLVDVVSTHLLPEKAQRIFETIKAADTATFALPEAVGLMSEYRLEKIKANSSMKSDIETIIKDKLIAQSKPVGFSIKSQVGGASTLLNASKRTNFTYKVQGFSGDIDEINNIESSRKLRDRLQKIAEVGGVLKFSHVESTVFTRNMRVIDSIMPDILASMLVDYYSGQGVTMASLCELSGEKALHGLGAAEISYKVKSFLRAVALGMVPSREWSTYLTAYGGYIIVRDDGMLLCYHLYNDDDFRDYLFNSTKLDTPSTSRHDFGYLYEQDGEVYLKLNLQVRFC